MTHLLDTNTCIEFLRWGLGSPVAARLAAQPPGEVVAELLYGAERSNDPARVRGQVAAFTAGYDSLPSDDAAVDRGLTLVTHNTAEFGRVLGLAIEDWQAP
jgi:tRNA(fMet)-specific endonuclease VapC